MAKLNFLRNKSRISIFVLVILAFCLIGAIYIETSGSPLQKIISYLKNFGLFSLTASLSTSSPVAVDNFGDTTLPQSFDWRNVGGENYITPAKNQGGLGACTDFAYISALEGKIEAYYNDPTINPDLSEQDLVSCGYGSFSDYATYIGITTESCYPYSGTQGTCNKCSDWQNQVWKANPSSEVYIHSAGSTSDPLVSITAMKKALINNGPVKVSMYVGNLLGYTGGILDPGSISNYDLHAITIVGYSEQDGIPYWIVKNSWGPTWGENGFFRIKVGTVLGIDQMGGFVPGMPYYTTPYTKLCTDSDNDNYCYWGVGSEPATGCPSSCSVNTLEDCDDSNSSIHMGCGDLGTGILDLSSNPPGADVHVQDAVGNWSYRGGTPISFNLNPGTRSIKLSQVGYSDKIVNANIVIHQTTSLHVSFLSTPDINDLRLFQPSRVSTNSAILSGQFTYYGLASSGYINLYWGLNNGGQNQGNWNNMTTITVDTQGHAQGDTINFYKTIYGLNQNTTYYFSASDDLGINWPTGGSISFKTITQPSVSTPYVWVANTWPSTWEGSITKFDISSESTAGHYTVGTNTISGGIAVDASGNVWVTDNDSVIEFDSSGVPKQTYNIGGHTNKVAIDGLGNIWITNVGNTNVTELSPSGDTYTSKTYNIGTVGYGIAADSSGNIWIATYYGVTELALSGGTYITKTYNFSAGGGPSFIAIDGLGNVWITNYLLNSVTELSPSLGDTYTMTTHNVGTPTGGIAVDASGNIWVADNNSNSVTKLDPAGNVPESYSIGPVKTRPRGIAVDASGNVWVIATDNTDPYNIANYIIKLSPSGNTYTTKIYTMDSIGGGFYAYGDFTGFALQNFVLGGATGPTLPSVTLSPATNIDTRAATLNGNIGVNGQATVTVYWGTQDGGTNPVNCNGSQTTNCWQNSYTLPATIVGNFSQNITNLTTETYYFTASATNSAGTSWPSASLNFTTTSQIITTINIIPQSTTISRVQQLTATAFDQNGSPFVSQPTFTWASSRTSVATVNSSGLVTAISAGDANITASSGSVISNPATIKVTSASTHVSTPYVWIANTWQANVLKFDPSSGSILGPYSVGTGPKGIAVDVKNDNVWVANASGSVTQLDLSGNLKNTYSVGGTPNSVAIDLYGNVWITNTVGVQNAIIQLVPSGDTYTIKQYSTNKLSYGIAADALGNVWVAESAPGGQGYNPGVVKFTPSGDTYTQTSYNVGSVASGIAVDAYGDVWIVYPNNITELVLSGGNYTLKQYSVGGGNGGIAVDASNNVWFANNNTNSITKLDQAGNIIGTYPTGISSGTAGGVAIDDAGNIWVTESTNNSVVKFDQSGTATIYPLVSSGSNFIYTSGDFTGFAYQYFVLGGAIPSITPPTVTSPTVTSITTNSATLGATIASNRGATIINTGVCWGTSPSPRINCASAGAIQSGAFTVPITGLPSNTFIYYAGYATNSAGTGYSIDGTFTTNKAYSIVINLSNATDITDTRATLNGNITNTGGENPTVTIYWGLNDGGTNPANWNSSSLPTSPTQPQGAVAFATNLVNLIPGARYYFSASASYTDGTVSWPTGGSLSFTNTNSCVISTPYVWVGNYYDCGGGIGNITRINTSDGTMTKYYHYNLCPTGVALDANGNVWTANYYYGDVIIELDSSGNQIQSYWDGGHPYNIAINGYGNAQVSYNGSGIAVDNSLNTWISPYGVAVDRSGNRWVVNKDSNTVTKLNLLGSIIGTYAVGTSPYGVALDANGNVWVTNRGDSDVRVQGHGSITELIPSGNTYTSKTYNVGGSPYGVALDANGNVWFTNYFYNVSTTSNFIVTKLNPSNGTTENYVIGNGRYYAGTFGDFTGFALQKFVLGCSLPGEVTPTVTISPPTYTATTATLNGNITATGGGENPTITVYWGRTDGNLPGGTWENSSNLGAKGVGSFSANIAGLIAGTKYYFSASATNSVGTSWPGASFYYSNP